jgi:iron complex outermembrane receptor protein
MRTIAVCCCAVLLAPTLLAATSPDLLRQGPQVPARGAARADTDTLRVPRLTAVLVSASRLSIPLAENPAATAVVGRDVLDAAPRGIAVDEVVALVPGVKVDNQADGKRVHMSIRGQGILSEHGLRGIDVRLDGLPLNDPSGFAADLYDVDWPLVSALEVQRGPAASLYGGGGSAGVLNVLTEDGGARRLSGEVSSVYGSNNFFRFGGAAGGSARDVNYRLSYTRNSGDGYRVHTAFHGDNLAAKAHWMPSASLRLTPILLYTDFFNQNAEGLNLTWLAQDRRQANPDALTYNEYINTRRVTGGVVGELAVAPDQTLAFTGFVRRTAYRESVPSSVIHRTMTAPGGTVQYTLTRPTGSMRHHLSVGTDVQWQSIDGYALPNLGDAVEGATLLSDQTLKQSGVGVFALDRVDVGAQWSVMLNLRYDRFGNRLSDHLQAGGEDLSGKADFQRVTARAGVTWSPTPSLNLFGNVGQGFLPPATEELEANPDQIGGFNRSLKPAVSLGQEIGARGTLGRILTFDLTLFHLDTDRDFDRYRVATRPLETFYRNAASSRRYGVESYLSWAPSPQALLQAAYTWSDFVYTNAQSAYGDVRGHRLPNSPVNQLAADAEYRFDYGLTLGLGTEVLDKWYVDPGNATTVDGYALVNVRAGYRLTLSGAAAELTLAVRNLFAKRYIAFTEPDPDGNSYQPAAERELFIGLKIQP